MIYTENIYETDSIDRWMVELEYIDVIRVLT